MAAYTDSTPFSSDQISTDLTSLIFHSFNKLVCYKRNTRIESGPPHHVICHTLPLNGCSLRVNIVKKGRLFYFNPNE